MFKAVLNHISILLLILFLAALADGFIYYAFDSGGPVRILRGVSKDVGGELTHAPGINAGSQSERSQPQLVVQNPVRDVNLQIIEAHGRHWRGRLTVGPHAESGFVILRLADRDGDEVPSEFHVQIYDSRSGLSESYASMSMRRLGVHPLVIAMSAIPVAILLFILAFRSRGREIKKLQSEGYGPIYKLTKRDDGYEIVFGLGSNHGLRQGQKLGLYDPTGRLVGELTALEVGPKYGRARVERTLYLQRDYLVGVLNESHGALPSRQGVGNHT